MPWKVHPPSVQPLFDAGLLSLDNAGRLRVYIHVDHIDQELRAHLGDLQAVLEREDPDQNLIQASVPLRNLSQVADLEYVTAVTAPIRGHTNVGSKLTEGDSLLSFAALRGAQGVNGSGVIVGVISDGIAGLADAIASGDLPATTFNRDGGGKLLSTSGGVIATSFRADGDLEGGLGSSATGAEGTAILEIIHDIAPGAQLRFANFNTSLEFIAAVDFLAANSDVVIDDISFYGAPYDQTSSISTNTADELNRLTNPIRGYFTSVGNSALKHYEEPYVDSGTDGAAFFGVAGSLHQFGPTAGSSDSFSLGLRTANSIQVAPGDSVTLILTWNDTFGSATTDYDLYLRENPSGPVVASSVTDNINVTGNPVESLAFTNTGGSTKFYDVFIQNFGSSAPKSLELFLLGTAVTFSGNGAKFNYNTIAGSVPAQSDAGGGVVSVGAINAADPGINTIEPFSSQGPTNNGATKPDVTAIDGVRVTGSAGFSDPFFGTSAAAPHAAGLAALLLQLRPDLLSGEAGDDPATDRAVLGPTIVAAAIDLGTAGSDNTFGHGRIHGLDVAAPLLVAPVVEAGPNQTADVNETVSLAPATFTDLNPLDTHTATIAPVDGGSLATGSVNQSADTVSGSHAYAFAGVFTVRVTVIDETMVGTSRTF